MSALFTSLFFVYHWHYERSMIVLWRVHVFLMVVVYGIKVYSSNDGLFHFESANLLCQTFGINNNNKTLTRKTPNLKSSLYIPRTISFSLLTGPYWAVLHQCLESWVKESGIIERVVQNKHSCWRKKLESDISSPKEISFWKLGLFLHLISKVTWIIRHKITKGISFWQLGLFFTFNFQGNICAIL